MKVLARTGELVKARVDKGLNAAKVARRAGLTKMGYNNIENNEHGADPQTAKNICEVLNKNFDDLFEIKLKKTN